MEKYIKTLTGASNEVWTVFKTAATTGKNPKLAFQQLCDKYKGTDAEKYVRDYVEICSEELPRIQNPQAYITEALKATVEMWGVFKAHAAKVYGNEMTDDDWNRLIKDATDVGYKRWDTAIKEYTKRYSALCVWELDRQYQKLHKIKENWYELI